MFENLPFYLVDNGLCNVLGVFFIDKDLGPGIDLLSIRKVLFIFIENNLVFVVR